MKESTVAADKHMIWEPDPNPEMDFFPPCFSFNFCDFLYLNERAQWYGHGNMVQDCHFTCLILGFMLVGQVENI